MEVKLKLKCSSLPNFLILETNGSIISIEELSEQEVEEFCKFWVESFKQHWKKKKLQK